ncbi:hypothetical protein ES703_32097 [subsurface metagenome]
MLSSIGNIIGIIAGVLVIIGAIITVAKGGLNIFGKINKIENIEKGTNALLLIHRNEIFDLYKDQMKIVLNPTPSPFPEKEYLLGRLESGYLTPEEAQRLTEILKYEEKEAKQKQQGTAVLAIGALLLLITLIASSKK